MKKYLIFLVFLLCLNIVSAAKIYGTVYDTSLLPVDKAIVEINTQPKQTYVTQDGKYSFNVPVGEYTIIATSTINEELYTESQNISVKDDGDYILDLILFPEIEEFEDTLDIDIEPGIDTGRNYLNLLLIIPLLIIVFIIFFLLKSKKTKKKEGIKEEIKAILEDDEELNKIYNIIKEAKRISQKDIRKQTGLSEAKISLIISQLESEGKIKKIKKGRTNIIISQ